MDQQILFQVARALDATPERLQAIARLPNFELARKALEELKAEVHKRYKKLAFEWHPDRNPGDPEAEAKFKALGQVLKELDKLQLQRPQPVFHRVVHFYRTSPYGGSVTTNTTATGFGAWHPFDSPVTPTRPYDARRVVFVKF